MSYNKIAQKHVTPIIEDIIGYGTIYPGMLLETYNNTVETVRVHQLAGGSGIVRLALEDSLNGDVPTTAYDSGDQVRTGIFRSGDKVAALVLSGETVNYGTKLEHAGSGKFRAMDSEAPSYLTEDSFLLIGAENAGAVSGDTLVLCRVK